MLSKKVKISLDVLSQEVGGETVLLDLKSEGYFGLDEVGTRIWQLLQEKGETDYVFQKLLEEYDVNEAQLQKDIEDLVGKLVETGLVEIEDQ